MKKIKKIFTLFLGMIAIFMVKARTICGMVSEYAIDPVYEIEYDAEKLEKRRHLIEISRRIDNVKGFVIALILVIIGVGVIINKKLSKKTKEIICFFLIFLGTAAIILINHYIVIESLVKKIF